MAKKSAIMVLALLVGCSPVRIRATDVQLGIEALFAAHQPGDAYNGEFTVRCAPITDFREENADASGATIVAARFGSLTPGEQPANLIRKFKFWRKQGAWKLGYNGPVKDLPCERLAVSPITDATYASAKVRDPQ